MKNYLLGILSVLVIVLIAIIVIILNTDIYFDDCWENNICEVRTIKVSKLIQDDYFSK